MIFNQQGVAVVLSPSAHEAWLAAGEERHHDLGARVLALRLAVVDSLTGSRLGVFLVSAQAPSSKDPHTEEWDAFYAALATAISRKQPGDVLVLGASANAAVGTSSMREREAAAREARCSQDMAEMWPRGAGELMLLKAV